MVSIDETWLNKLLTQNNPLSFTLFNHARVEKKWHYRDRVLDDHLLYFVTNHSFKALINGYIHLTPGEGSLLWIPPGIPHTFELVNREKPIELYYFRFKAETPCDSGTAIFFNKSGWHHRLWIEELYRECRQKQDLGEERIKAILFLILSRLWRETGKFSEREGLTAGQLERIYQFSLNHARARYSPKDLAAEAGLEQGYFTRQFRKTFGQSPRSWIIRERISRIQAELGESRLSLTKISEKYGYPDLFSLSKQFKKVTGESPRNYRKRII